MLAKTPLGTPKGVGTTDSTEGTDYTNLKILFCAS
jgi:hypothetical protein